MLRPFRFVPKDSQEWSRWCQAQTNPESNAPDGYFKVLNLYYDLANDELVVVYEDANGDEVVA